MDKYLNTHFTKEDRYTDGRYTHEKIFIINYQRNANMNHNEIPLHAYQNG